MAKRNTKKTRFVDFVDNDNDHECAFLGAFGFSTNYIRSKTHLSEGQVAYRLRKAQVYRSEFRDGTSTFAKLAVQNLRVVGEDKLVAHLHKYAPAPRVNVAPRTNAWGRNPRPLE